MYLLMYLSLICLGFVMIFGLLVCLYVLFDIFQEPLVDLCFKILFKVKPDLAQEIKDVMERGYVE